MTPLNFVCKRRAPPPRARTRARVSAKTRAEKFFRRMRAQKICARCRSADETWVFAASRCTSMLLLAHTRACARRRALSSARRRPVAARFAKPKKFCAGGLRGRVDGPREAQNARIEPTDSLWRRLRDRVRRRVERVRGSFRRRFGERGEFAADSCARGAATNVALRCRCASCRRSLTACGLALPPDAFITWPTNQPIAFGLVLASPTLSGFLATMSSTSFSIAETSVTCFKPRSSTIARGSPPSLQTISNTSLAILPEIVPSAMRSRMAPSCAAAHRRRRRCPCLPC